MTARAWQAHCKALEAEGIPFDRTQEALAYLGFPADACPGDIIVQLWGERNDLLRALARAVHRGPLALDSTLEAPGPHPDACWSEDPSSLRDCRADGHYSCKTCARRLLPL